MKAAAVIIDSMECAESWFNGLVLTPRLTQAVAAEGARKEGREDGAGLAAARRIKGICPHCV